MMLHKTSKTTQGTAPAFPTFTDQVRRKIETLSANLSLPTAKRALGLLEGEHRSSQPFGNDDSLGTRDYTLQDEARLIDWRVSARMGHPMVTERECLVTSHIHLMIDTGAQMKGTTPSGETVWDVACNALCMFAALSAKRRDTVSLVLADDAAITRMPCRGGLSQFERVLDSDKYRPSGEKGNLDALLSYAATHLNDESMIIIATDEQSLQDRHFKPLRRIASRHPLILINVATLNPFGTDGPLLHADIVEGRSGRRIPAFMRNDEASSDLQAHRTYLADRLDHEVKLCGAFMVRTPGSEALLHQLMQLLSMARNHSSQFQLRTIPSRTSGGAR